MVQIKNRVNGLYDRRGHNGWTDKMHLRGAWGCIGHAKTHICQKIVGYNFYEDEVRNYLDSEFIIVNEDYSITTEHISPYILSKLKEYYDYHKNKDWVNKRNIEFCEEIFKEFNYSE